MTTNKLFTAVTLLAGLAWSINCSAQLAVKSGDAKIAYMGRVKTGADSALIYWPGSSATINFNGTGVKAAMKSRREPGYYYAIMDGDASKAFKFGADSIRKDYVLASGLPAGKHTLQLFKLSNNTSEDVFYGFSIDGDAKLLDPAKPAKRKIEFYGNSITAGHGVDVPPGQKETGAPEYFNNYYTYAALTARHYQAQYSCIARSGIGIMISWFPEIMPEIYDCLDPIDPDSKWDFANYTPDVVVINLFQNDYWLINNPNHEQFKRRFGTAKPNGEFIINAYQNFVAGIRAKYPKAQIICALGNMNATETGSKFPGYIEQAVAQLKDSKIHTCFFPYKNTGGHPNKAEQQRMADQLISFIDKTVKW